LPDAKDPDEYLQKHPKEDLKGLLTQAPDFFRWRAASLKRKLQDKPPEERVRALKGLVPVILMVPDEAGVQSACAAVEAELGLDNRDMLSIVNAERKKGPGRSAPTPSAGKEETPRPREKQVDFQMESDFLALLTEENGAFVPWAQKEISTEVFYEEKFRKLFEGIQAGSTAWQDLKTVGELEASFLKVEAETQKRTREALLLDLANALKKRHLKRQMDALKGLQAEAEKAGEMEKALQLGQEIVILKRQYSQGVELK